MAEERTFAERLELARRNAGFNSPRAAAQAFQWNGNTYKARENGQRGMPTHDVVQKYAKAFGVSFVWLATGEGLFVTDHKLKVMGKIGAGAAILPDLEQLPASGLYEIQTLIPLPEGSIAFEIEGDSMWPRYDPGDVVICWREGSNADEVIGWEAAVRTFDGHRYLKRVLKGSEPETFDLESHNAPPIRSVRLEWIAQVHAVVRADMWRNVTPAQSKRIARQMAPIAKP